MMSYIYKTTNLINGKIYIGKSSKDDPSYLGSGIIIKEAIQKYGVENFIREIIEYCSDDVIDQREIFWIDQMNARIRGIGYNIAPGGFGGDNTTTHPNKEVIVAKRTSGLKEWHSSLSDEEKKERAKNISNAKKGKSNGREGYTHPEETIEKMRTSALNRDKSDEWKISHMAAMAKRRGTSLVKKYKRIEVNGVIYESVKDAIASLGIKHRKTFYDMINRNEIRVKYL
jgi:group I intron endonuclease